MSDSKALAFLRGIKDRISEPYDYSYSWERDETDGSHEAGMLIWVIEGHTKRQFRVTVTDLMTLEDAGYLLPPDVAGSAEVDGGA